MKIAVVDQKTVPAIQINYPRVRREAAMCSVCAVTKLALQAMGNRKRLTILPLLPQKFDKT
jgi:hypothetical protein